MPHETITTWTCSRCGAQEVTEGTDRPKNWSEISYRLLRGRDTESHVIGELCNECGGDHYSWVQGDDEQIERDRWAREQIAALETAEP